MTITNDTCNAVAAVINELQISCIACLGQSVEYIVCRRCDGRGWIASKNLDSIITNVKYPLTILLENDMIGWHAEIQFDGKSLTFNNKNIFDNPVDAVYEALFEALTDKLGTNKIGQLNSQHTYKKPRRTRGRGRRIKTVQESVQWLTPRESE